MTATDPQLAALLAERLEPAAEALAGAYVEDMSTGPPPEDDRARVPPVVTPDARRAIRGLMQLGCGCARGPGSALARRPGRRIGTMRLRQPAGGREES
ncbi:MAG: hypothetical protein F4Y03_09100 [Alphaproteobacteria bacterium]|nr:hypothetical protein [Alphaproteobacteria bacterium]